MAHINGLMLIDAPASALNNAGSVAGERTDNKVAVKFIRVKGGGAFPYISAQAFRYWLRNTLESSDLPWETSPIYRESKVAYTDANPILYWDDDLFGYMRAPSKRVDAVEAREGDESQKSLTKVEGTITRVSPFKASTLVSLEPVNLTDDFGVMSRHDGDPVPHEHQFYKTTLKGAFGLDLRSAGTFWHREKTGYRNLDANRKQQAEERGLEPFDNDRAFRLPKEDRIQRVRTLFEGMAMLDGGAKQTLHYTNVAPSFTISAVTKGGNNPFVHVVGADPRSVPQINMDALEEALDVFSDQFLSPVYIGWAKGFMDARRGDVEGRFGDNHVIDHPRRIFERIAADLGENPSWLD